MEIYDGFIMYNQDQRCYGMMGNDGNWVKGKLENGDRIDIVINGERFSTNFEGDSSHPALKPHSWDNWEFLSGLPAAYYSFDTTAKKEPLPKKDKTRSRCRIGLLCIATSIAYSVVFGALLALLRQDVGSYLDNIVTISEVTFFMFGAGLAAGGLLLIANIIPEKLCIGFGCALYYGTIFLSSILSKFIDSADINRYIISFTIVSLVCYIAWLKGFKMKYEEEES